MYSENSGHNRSRDEYKEYIMGVQSEERKRISWMLHDTVLQDMAAFIKQIDLSCMMIDRGSYADAEKNLYIVQNNIRDSINILRNNIYNIDPVDICADNIQSMIYDMSLRKTENTNIDVKVSVDKFNSVSSESVPWNVCYRIITEAVSNSVAHSGCSVLTVMIENMSDDKLRISVKDNGHGFDVNKEKLTNHFGLSFIKENAELTNSRLAINSSDVGTEVEVVMPLRKKGTHE